MQVTFWGTRGSIPSPGFGTARFGGNTVCVQVTTDAGTQIILDCGTGARLLGDRLLAEAGPSVKGHILLSHTHWDHIQGFPFFQPVFRPGNEFTVHAPAGGERSLSEALAGQMQYTYFPVSLEQLEAAIQCVDLQEGVFNVAEVRVQAHYLNHPGLTLGYRLACGGVSVVYATDHEPFGLQLYPQNRATGRIDQMLHEGDRQHALFLAGADLVIHDAQYTAEEYQQKHNWGHSPMEYVVALAVAAGVKRLLLFHHDPDHDDAQLARIERTAAALAQSWGSDLDVRMAHEGLTLYLPEVARPVDDPSPRHAPHGFPVPAARILLIGDAAPERDVISQALRSDGHTLVVADDGTTGLDLAGSVYPDLILLDVEAANPSGIAILRTLRADPDPRIRDAAVLLLTDSEDETLVSSGFAAGATDYMHKPFSQAQLRTRVRTWLERMAAKRQQ